jgi:hypothetical protein
MIDSQNQKMWEKCFHCQNLMLMFHKYEIAVTKGKVKQ